MITVTYLEASDRSDWEPLFDAYIAFYEAEVPARVIDLAFERMVAKADGMVGFIARDSALAIGSSHPAGAAVGLAHLVFHRSTWAATTYCYLEDLFVAPEVRGKGVARQLFDATYREADARGAERTYWATAENNATARRLYDRVGELTAFVQYRR